MLLRQEMARDRAALNLSALESYMLQAVREALAAPLPRKNANKKPSLLKFHANLRTIASEGYPGRRFHSGRQIVN